MRTAGEGVIAKFHIKRDTTAQSTILLPKVLLALGALKLAIVVWILRNTHRANHGDWNDKAVDFRYLAERLRAMFYLPRIGSFHPPAPDPPQYASRAVRQSSVDWLFNAIVRSVSPAVFAKPATFAGHNAATREVRVLSLDSLGLLRDVRRSWLGEQAVYHDRNARTMGRMHEFAESASSWLSITVIVCVSADVLILLAEALHLMPEEWVHVTQAWTPWLVFLAALLPASVASLNGIRFQSECRRLAERSSVMRTILLGRSDQNGRIGLADLLIARIAAGQFEANTDPAAWSLDVLRLTETVATDFIQEASEWSVVYAKEMPDPG